MVKLILVIISATMASSQPLAASVSQVHLGLTNAAIGCPAGVSVNFASSTQSPITVKFAPLDGKTESVQTKASNYKVKSYTSPYLHAVNLCNLVPATKYTYSMGDFKGSFVSPPALSANPTVLGILGDADLEADAFSQFLQPVQNFATQAIVIVGDYSYANGNHKQWDRWYALQQPVFSTIPNVGINGNHEVIQSSSGYDKEYYLGYLRRAATPITQANADKLRTYYSINVGLVHLVFLDDYVGCTESVGSSKWLQYRNDQVDWLERDLSAVNRTTTPYVVVAKHNPYYNTYDDHQCQCSESIYEIEDPEACWRGEYYAGKPKSEPHCGLQAKFEDLYAEARVDVVFSGHVHGYERSEYVYKNAIDKERGSVYITTGAAGRGHAGDRIGSIPSWNAFAEGEKFGASRLIATREKMQVLWFTNDNLDTPADSVELYPRL